MRVPLLDLKAQYAAIRPEIEAAVGRILESQRFVLGPEVEALERELAAWCGVRHAVTCGSGSDALLLALMALDVGPGDEVVCPAYTFFSTAGSVARLGATPVFADVDPRTLNVDARTLEAAARSRGALKALLPVHLFGRPAPMGAILALGDRLGAAVIEDAAQAIGAQDAGGRRVGGLGRLACFSFYPSKNLGAYGEGGAVTTDDEALADALRVLRVHGSDGSGRHRRVGLNSRLDALQAAVLRVKLRHLEAWTEARRARAAAYDELFSKAGAAAGPGEFEDLALPVRTPLRPPEPARHAFNQYVIRVPARRRDALRGFLDAQQVGSAVYYPLPLHLQPCFASLGNAPGDLPAAERAARETLALPIYPELTRAQLEFVVERVADFLRR